MYLDDIQAISYVKRAKNRQQVFKLLEEPKMPSEIVVELFGKSSNTHFNIVSRALKELSDTELVEILNPKEKTGRLYQLTKAGSRLKKKV